MEYPLPVLCISIFQCAVLCYTPRGPGGKLNMVTSSNVMMYEASWDVMCEFGALVFRLVDSGNSDSRSARAGAPQISRSTDLAKPRAASMPLESDGPKSRTSTVQTSSAAIVGATKVEPYVPFRLPMGSFQALFLVKYVCLHILGKKKQAIIIMAS